MSDKTTREEVDEFFEERHRTAEIITTLADRIDELRKKVRVLENPMQIFNRED